MNTASRKKIAGRIVNYVLLGLMLILIFSPVAKSWFLEKLIRVGIFNTKIKPVTKQANSIISNNHFSYIDNEGTTRTTADLGGQVVFINFWASWCPPCLAEMPSLNNLYRQFAKDPRIVFLFVNEDEDKRKAIKYLNDKEYHFPLITSAGPVPAGIYDGTLPTTVILDSSGRIVYRHTGIANYNTGKFVDQLKELFN